MYNSSSLQIVLVRPGSTDLDDQGRITGALDVPLSEAGRIQMNNAVTELGDFSIERIYAAPCQSAQQSASTLSRNGEIKIKVDNSLANLDYGLWHGKLIEELKETQPKLFKQWQEHPENVCPPEGETIEDVRSRVERFLKKIIKKHRSGTILVVAPEPLASIFRSEIEIADLEDVWQIDGKFGCWDVVAIGEESVV